MDMTRRQFLFGSAASVALGGCGRIFAAPLRWRHGGRPNLVFGVISDSHISSYLHIMRRYGGKPEIHLEAALEYFRDADVDAVVHCGDLTNRGWIEEMEICARAWRNVFPGNNGAGGRHVEKLFVTGNHDDPVNCGFDVQCPEDKRVEDVLMYPDWKGNWRRIWGEEYEETWHKEVNGYHFFGRQWGWYGQNKGVDEMPTADLVAKHIGAGEAKKPYFVISHEPTHEPLSAELMRHPGAFGFFGHWHRSMTNWDAVRFVKGMPLLQCPSLDCRDGGNNYPFTCLGGKPLDGAKEAGAFRQGFVVRVYDDMMVFERREFSEGGSLGADWVMPFTWAEGCGMRDERKHPLSLDEMKKHIGVPQFPPKACLEVRRSGDAFAITIPHADGNPDPAARVYAYEVVSVTNGEPGTANGEKKPKYRKIILAAGCNMGIGHETDGGATTLRIPFADLPDSETPKFAARPLNSLGMPGRAIGCLFLSKTAQKGKKI